MKIFGLPGTSFSPRRAIGVDVLKRSVAKKTGVPLTKSGAERRSEELSSRLSANYSKNRDVDRLLSAETDINGCKKQKH